MKNSEVQINDTRAVNGGKVCWQHEWFTKKRVTFRVFLTRSWCSQTFQHLYGNRARPSRPVPTINITVKWKRKLHIGRLLLNIRFHLQSPAFFMWENGRLPRHQRVWKYWIIRGVKVGLNWFVPGGRKRSVVSRRNVSEMEGLALRPNRSFGPDRSMFGFLPSWDENILLRFCWRKTGSVGFGWVCRSRRPGRLSTPSCVLRLLRNARRYL